MVSKTKKKEEVNMRKIRLGITYICMVFACAFMFIVFLLYKQKEERFKDWLRDFCVDFYEKEIK